MTKFVCISDTHSQLKYVNIPDGDILLHSGDLTGRGGIQETSREVYEISKHRQRFKAIVLIEGNHDRLGEFNPTAMDQMCLDSGITLLRDTSTTIEGFKFYGSPYTPEFHNWAFNLPRGQALKDKWSLIPDDTQILMTHCPPMGILDNVQRYDAVAAKWEIEHAGCANLYNRIQDLKYLKLSVFGHLHANHGQFQIGNTTFINASTCTEKYNPSNPPIVIDL